MSKGLIYLAVAIGSTLGAYLPVLVFGVDIFSVWSIAGSVVASIGAIIITYRWFN